MYFASIRSVSIIFLLATSLSSYAATPTRLGSDTEAPPQRLALLIGNSDYQHLNKLKNPKNDVDKLATKLTALGFQTDRKYDLTHDQFVDALSAFHNKIEPGAIALFYYSGHGAQLSGTNYLVPVSMASGANAVTVQGSGIPLGLVRDALSSAKLSLIVLDACRTVLNLPAKGSVEGLAAFFSRGAFIAYAADEGQAASDNDTEDLSLFTKHLIKELDKHNETLCHLFEGVRAAVDEASAHVQFPFVYDGVIGDFIFNRTSTEELEKISTLSYTVGPTHVWSSIQNSDNPNDFAAFLTPTVGDSAHSKLADHRLSSLMSATVRAVGIVPFDQQEPPQVVAITNQARRLFYEKAYDSALNEYKKLLESRTSDPVLLYNYGTCLLQLGREDDAIKALSRAAELEPESPWTYFNRGVAEHLKGNFREALVDYNRALEGRPGYAPGYNNIALAKRDLGDFPGAQVEVQKAIALDPHYAPAFFNGAEISSALGNAPVARSYEQVGKTLTIPDQGGDQRLAAEPASLSPRQR